MYEHARKHGLTGADAMVFEALVFLCKKKGECKISYAKLAEFSCCGNKITAYYSVQRLINRGLVFNNLTGSFKILTETFNNLTNPKEESTKEENIKQIKSNQSVPKVTDKGRTDGLFSEEFLSFWKGYKPDIQFNNRKSACYELFQKLPADWRKLAIERAPNHAVATNPYFWLQEEAFLRVVQNSDVVAADKPGWLSGQEQDDCLRGGIMLVVCRNPETGLFGTVTLDDAKKFNLEITREIKKLED